MRPTIIMLPATPPGDSKYGLTPHQYPELGDRALRVLPLNRQVWYNDAICAQAAAWILEQNAPSVILIGFSKSALGAWKLTQILGERVHATVMFDAPVARLKLPPWDTATFYRDDADWQQDLPINTLHSFAASRTSEHKLILISGLFPRRDEPITLCTHRKQPGARVDSESRLAASLAIRLAGYCSNAFALMNSPSPFPLDLAHCVYVCPDLKNNPVPANDHSQLLQAAVNQAAMGREGGVVFLQPGVYRLDKTLQIWRGVRLLGHPSLPTILELPACCKGFWRRQ
ncbi:MAG: glycoside hydrolase family 55 protein [Verrucomicrobia bacterium]|nr:glycoside hydrolase family 55 protein [Verrucomicrobiota bacterium]